MLQNLKGKDRLETVENYSIATVVLGTILLSVGIATSATSSQGIPVVLAVLGAFVSFISIIILLSVWLIRNFREN